MNDRLLRPLLGALLLSSLGSLAFAVTSASSLASLRTNAEKGNAIAQYNLGLVLANPSEPAYDLVQAYVWLSRAAASGSRSRELNRVSDLLTSAQMREAQALLTQTPTVSITPLDDEDFGPATPPAAPSPGPTGSADQELRKRLAIAESALAVRERDLAKLREELDAQSSPNTLDGTPNAVAEIEFLRTQLAAATGDAKTLREELATLRATQSTAQQSREELTAKLSQTENELAALRAQASTATSLQTELAATRQKLAAQSSNGPELAAAQAKIQSLSEEIANSWKSQGRLQSQIAENKQAYEIARAEAESLKAARDAQAQDLVAAQNRIAQLTTELTQSSSPPAVDPATTHRLQTLEAQLATASQTQNAQANELANARARIEQLQVVASEQSTSLQSEISRLRAQLAQATATPATDPAATARFTALETQLAESNQLRTQLAQALEQTREELRTSTADLATTRATLARARSESAPDTSGTELALVREQLAAVASQRDELQRFLAQHDNSQTTQVSTLQAELNEVRAQLNQSNRTVETLRHQLETAAVETDVLRAAQAEIDQLHQELATAQQAAAARAESSPPPAVIATTDENQEKLATTLRAFAAVEAQLRTSRQKLDAAQKDAEADAARIADLERRLAELQPTLATAQVAAEHAESEASDATVALTETRAQLAATQTDLDRISREFATFRESSAEQFRISEFLAAKNADLSTQVRQMQEQYAVASRELADLRTRYALSVTNAVASSPHLRTTPARPTPTLSAGVRTHTVVSGDSLSNIALQYLGSEDRWPEIYAANRSTLSATNGVRAGMVLLIP